MCLGLIPLWPRRSYLLAARSLARTEKTASQRVVIQDNPRASFQFICFRAEMKDRRSWTRKPVLVLLRLPFASIFKYSCEIDVIKERKVENMEKIIVESTKVVGNN